MKRYKILLYDSLGRQVDLVRKRTDNLSSVPDVSRHEESAYNQSVGFNTEVGSAGGVEADQTPRLSSDKSLVAQPSESPVLPDQADQRAANAQSENSARDNNPVQPNGSEYVNAVADNSLPIGNEQKADVPAFLDNLPAELSRPAQQSASLNNPRSAFATELPELYSPAVAPLQVSQLPTPSVLLLPSVLEQRNNQAQVATDKPLAHSLSVESGLSAGSTQSGGATGVGIDDLANAISKAMGAMKVYVVESDISDAQRAVRASVEQAAF